MRGGRGFRHRGLHGLSARWNELADENWVAQRNEITDADRSRRSLERGLRRAKLGPFKPLAAFDWSSPSRLDQELVDDVVSRKNVGSAVHEHESATLAAELVRELCLAEGVTRQPLVLRADDGAPMNGAAMLATLQQLGIVPPFSRPSVSNDNPFSEALFSTLEYRPEHPISRFASLTAARDWVRDFVTWYNDEHRHRAIRFVTPAQRHAGLDTEILARRARLYARAKGLSAPVDNPHAQLDPRRRRPPQP
ncbi:MAG: transposase [Planctomycetes bacterium]|nr:transposase [Planctomycetota bacterium]